VIVGLIRQRVKICENNNNNNNNNNNRRIYVIADISLAQQNIIKMVKSADNHQTIYTQQVLACLSSAEL
jgi:hypothetical protein